MTISHKDSAGTAPDLFPTLQAERRPLMVELRERYEAAREALDKAEAWADDTGEAVPREIHQEFSTAQRLLCAEESRVASQHST